MHVVHELLSSWKQRKNHERANSSQQPTRGRSLARRFRASFRATLRVAPQDREGRERLSERTLGGPKDVSESIQDGTVHASPGTVPCVHSRVLKDQRPVTCGGGFATPLPSNTAVGSPDGAHVGAEGLHLSQTRSTAVDSHPCPSKHASHARIGVSPPSPTAPPQIQLSREEVRAAARRCTMPA